MEQPVFRAPKPQAGDWPTVLHVTHWKAGSQWIHKILSQCAADRVVTPQHDMVQFFQAPVQSGMIYPTLYVTKEEFDRVIVPPNSRRFVVIRDLRDTLVSLYFSVKVSHVDNHPLIAEGRVALNARRPEDGLLWVLESTGFEQGAKIQQSWHAAGEKLIRYEDLLVRNAEVLERLLADECGMPVERKRLREIIQANRFEKLTGRARGQEDVSSHERKGVAGDWRNHFTDRIKRVFKDRFGSLLVATGYETGFDW